MPEATAEQIGVYSDSTATDGYRVIRLSYEVAGRRMVFADQSDVSGVDSLVYADDASFLPLDVFASLMFDPSGALIAMYTDRPWA
jgi:hypothetical protein